MLHVCTRIPDFVSTHHACPTSNGEGGATLLAEQMQQVSTAEDSTSKRNAELGNLQRRTLDEHDSSDLLTGTGPLTVESPAMGCDLRTAGGDAEIE